MRQDEISGSVSVTYSASMQAGAIYVMALQPGVSDETSQDSREAGARGEGWTSKF